MQRIWLSILNNGKFSISIEGLGNVGNDISNKKDADMILSWLKTSGLYFPIPDDHK